MKIMIASDIHGSEQFCKKLMTAYEKENPDKLLLLGDILYHGPRNALPGEYNPKGVIEMLNNIKDKIMCVRGNCDTEVDQMVLEFPILSDYCIIYVKNHLIYATHGHHIPDTSLFSKNDVVLHGHTHIPKCEKEDDVLFLNPGSVSIPKNNSQNSYMILEDTHLYWKNLDMQVYNEFDLENM
ncbi:MAG: phosphodiesterase [Ruminococcaceae bacterium]|nr:phosphodiesterase [Oscillospiraceae bacterium]